MEKKPKNVRSSKAAGGKGFYIAMYSSLGGLLLLALGIGYYSFLGPGANQNEIEIAPDREYAVWDWDYEADDYPVSGSGLWDTPVTAQPRQTPEPQVRQPQITDEPAAPQRPGGVPQGYEEDWEQDWSWDDGYGQLDSDHDADDELVEDNEVAEPDTDIYNVFDPQTEPQHFSYFTEGDTMHWPVLGEVVMDFAMDRLVFDATLDQWRVNDVLAIGANRGDTVRAAAPGRVQEVTQTRQFGQRVVIDHGNGWLTTYSQLDPDVVVDEGDVVSRGQIIGSVGSPSIFTVRLGYHLGFAVTNNDAPVDPNSLLMRD